MAVLSPGLAVPGLRRAIPENPQSCQIATHTPANGGNAPAAKYSDSQYRAAGEPSQIRFFQGELPEKQHQVASQKDFQFGEVQNG